jgi:hypothetical protein
MKNGIRVVWDITCKVCEKTFEQVSRGGANAHRLYCSQKCRHDAYVARTKAKCDAIELRRAQERAASPSWAATVRDRSDLSSTCKLVAFVIWSFANECGMTEKSLSDIGTATGLNRRTVIVSVQYLETRGLIAIVKRRNLDGSSAPSQYRLLVGNAAVVATGLNEKQMRLCG